MQNHLEHDDLKKKKIIQLNQVLIIKGEKGIASIFIYTEM